MGQGEAANHIVPSHDVQFKEYRKNLIIIRR